MIDIYLMFSCSQVPRSPYVELGTSLHIHWNSVEKEKKNILSEEKNTLFKEKKINEISAEFPNLQAS